MTGTAFNDALDNDDLGSNKIARSATAYVLYNNGLAAWESAHALILDTQTYTSNGSWSKPAGLDSRDTILIRALGAGGGAFSTNHAGGGGCCEVTLSAADCPSSLTITIGSGGTTGVAGGDTTVTNGSSLTLKGKGGGSQSESFVGGLMEINGATIKDPGLKGGDGGSGSDNDAFLGGASGNGTSVLGGAGNGGFPGGGGKYLGTTTGGNGKVVIYALRGWHPAKYNLSV